MYTLFISDLHLDAGRPELTEIFLRFLDKQARQADALYILGDFFEMWLGDDIQSSFTQTICDALKALTGNGVPVYFMHGNRDFLLGQQFLSQSGCQLLNDPSVINLYGTPALLMHGDTLCWQDIDYLKFRRIARNTLYQRIFLSLPLFLRRYIGHHLRRQSSQKTTPATIQLSDATAEAISQTVAEYKAKLLIHGHTHRPGIQLQLSALPFTRIVLSDWETKGNALIYFPDNTYQLIFFH